jgi:sugar/nucleoside kinase (ribokinase family)
MKFQGLFVGLATLDLIYLIKDLPTPNQKIVALEQMIAAGGPATNAAVTFSSLGNQAKLLAAFGNHPLTKLIYTDLNNYSINTIDLQPNLFESPPVSSILVTQSTGERAIISLNAAKIQAKPAEIPINILEGIDIILFDGHQIEVSKEIALQAKNLNIPIVIDGGSWKPGLEEILPYVDYAICSADFYPPGCQQHQDVFDYLQTAGITNIAITQGSQPIQYLSKKEIGKLAVPQVPVKDTLGAGDIFHGAFCYYILHQPFVSALNAAGKVASHSCKFFGTRNF